MGEHMREELACGTDQAGNWKPALVQGFPQLIWHIGSPSADGSKDQEIMSGQLESNPAHMLSLHHPDSQSAKVYSWWYIDWLDCRHGII